MATYSLSATKRESVKNSARDTREENRVPAVVYGSGTDSTPISLDASDILRTYRKAKQSALIDLDLDGKTIKVLIHALNLHPVTNTIHHVDFYAVDLTKKTTVNVPLSFMGESPAVKNFGGVFMKDHDTLEIRCLPTEIPAEIKVDISSLENIHDHITIEELNLDEKYELVHLSPDTLICSVTGRMAEEEEPVVAEEEEGEEGEEGEAAEGDGGEGGEAGEEKGAEEEKKD